MFKNRRPEMSVSRRRQAGVEVVEVALLLPFVLVFFFGIIEFGLMVYDKAVVSNASREAARSGAALRIPALTGAQVRAIAQNYCANVFSLGAPGAVCQAPVPNVPGNNAIFTGVTQLTVTVNYTYTPLVLGSLMNLLSLGALPATINMTNTTSMYYE